MKYHYSQVPLLPGSTTGYTREGASTIGHTLMKATPTSVNWCKKYKELYIYIWSVNSHKETYGLSWNLCNCTYFAYFVWVGALTFWHKNCNHGVLHFCTNSWAKSKYFVKMDKLLLQNWAPAQLGLSPLPALQRWHKFDRKTKKKTIITCKATCVNRSI